MNPTGRIEVLDSVRGIAAFSVVLHHCFLVLPYFYLTKSYLVESNSLTSNIVHSPLHLFFAGHEAVMLFFILSGFVLALPFLQDRPYAYLPYLLKRFIRIYIPYMISIVLSFLLFSSIVRVDGHYLSDWFRGMWAGPPTLNHLISYVFMTGYDTHRLNTVTWSLIYEMRISLFFPLLMILVKHLNWKTTLIGGFVVFWGGWLGCNVLVPMTGAQWLYAVGSTLYYVPFFLAGALLAKHREDCCNFVRQLLPAARLMLMGAAVLLYTAQWTFFSLGKLQHAESVVMRELFGGIIDVSIGAGVAVFLVQALASRKIIAVLSRRFFVRLGTISYSLYLVHSLVLLTVVHLLLNYMPLRAILLIVPVLSIAAAGVFYRFVEQPTIRLGKKVSQRFS